jgi:hypothetical protein
MAYIIRQGNILSKIAKDDTDKNEQNLSSEIYSSIDISDSDFLKLKKSRATVTIDGDNVTINDVASTTFEDSNALTLEIDSIKYSLKQFLDISSNSSKAIYSVAQTYYNTLDIFDVSTISFPLNKTWEEYCEENSITYIHPLQIP